MQIQAVHIAIEKIDAQLKSQPPEKLKQVNEALNIELWEVVAWQDLKSMAFASGKINLDVANFLYLIIGSTPEHFNQQSIATKYLVTNVMKNLMEWKMGL